MKNLIGKKISFYGANFAGRINEKGVVKSVTPTLYNEKWDSDVTLEGGYTQRMNNKDIARLLEKGILGNSSMLIGDPMEIEILD